MKELIAQQVANEMEAYNGSLDKYEEQLKKAINNDFSSSKEAIILFRACIDGLIEYLDTYKTLDLRLNNSKIRDLMFGAYPSSKDLSFVILKVVISNAIGGEEKTLTLSSRMAKQMSSFIQLGFLEQREVDKVTRINRTLKRHKKHKRQRVLLKEAKLASGLEIDKTFLLTLGTTLLDIVFKSGIMLLTKTQKTDATYIKLSNEAKELLTKSKVFFGSLLTIHYPFITTPRRWTGLEGSGGYYTNQQVKFIRTRSYKDFTLIRQHQPNVERLIDIVNNIQETPYRINKRVLEVMEYVNTHSILDPSSTERSPWLLGKVPYNEKLNPKETLVYEDYNKPYEYYRALDNQEASIQRIESKRVGYELSLMIAKKFQKYNKIYFSYNVDFRGRLYPIQQYLNPQGTDISKSMLEFGNGYQLTDGGFYWLCIHGANCYGYDKLPYEDRFGKITKEHHDEIMSVYRDPLAHSRYWCDTDSPYMYLAFCFSYGDYITDPSIPCYNVVALDGTCSGLQMYAGLLKDKEGAQAVNVINNDSRTISDVYKTVADVVETLLRDGDFPRIYEVTTKGGMPRSINTVMEAQSLRGNVTRNLTKRNVMTQPYSVTRRGMFEQVYDLLQEYEENNKVFWKGDKWTVATLLADLNDKAITKVVKGAKEGQRILKEVLHEALVKDIVDYAYWETPLFNFPVLQRIKKEKRMLLRAGSLGQLVLYNPTDETHVIRMLNGIAPNFIHSLDATVLYRTVELCLQQGVAEFWLIHDSYGVHPNNVDTLNTAFRQAYYDVFSNNPLESWATTILPKGGKELSQSVMINTLNLEDVLVADYVIT